MLRDGQPQRIQRFNCYLLFLLEKRHSSHRATTRAIPTPFQDIFPCGKKISVNLVFYPLSFFLEFLLETRHLRSRFWWFISFAFHINYRTLLRSSTNMKPSHPLHRVVFCFCFDLKSFLQKLHYLCFLQGFHFLEKNMKFFRSVFFVMILPQVHLRKPCYDFSFL